LLALILPPSLPLGMAFLGAVVAISLGKHIFGGLGSNIFNPALLGRAFLMAAFPVKLTNYIEPFKADAVTSATPLTLWKFDHIFVSLKSLFLGTTSGSLGETSSLFLLLGGIYILLRKAADWRIPLSILSTVAVYSGILYFINPSYGTVLFHLFSGGIMIGAFFMATDPVTSPVTKKGRYIFGILIGVMVITIRIWGGLPEGVMYSILFANALTPLINQVTKQRSFGR
jgi:electron transport complex protein RnfD